MLTFFFKLFFFYYYDFLVVVVEMDRGGWEIGGRAGARGIRLTKGSSHGVLESDQRR